MYAYGAYIYIFHVTLRIIVRIVDLAAKFEKKKPVTYQ